MPMLRSITDEQLEWAAEMIRTGHSIRRVAKALRISKTALWYDLDVGGYDLTQTPLEFKAKEEKGNENNNKGSE